jgi:tRNA threonylcarbamoyladenosine biosynthesis protein TsaE
MIIGRQNHAFTTDSAEQTKAAGKELARLLRKSDIIIFTGPLGAGKTTFIKGIALGLGIKENDVKSPSFTLVNEYPGAKPLYHFDLYRMKNSSELYEIGWDDYLLRDCIIVVEWGEKAGAFLPEKRVEISMEIINETQRKISLTFIGE